jgi:micrococcal nuclease
MYEYSIQLREVYDGDTVVVDIDLGFDVWLKDQRVRIDGIDAPEIKSKDATEKRFGAEAREFLRSLLEGRLLKLTVEKYDSTEKYGRILGDIVYGVPNARGGGYLYWSARDQLIAYGRAKEYHGGPR